MVTGLVHLCDILDQKTDLFSKVKEILNSIKIGITN